MEAEFTCAPSMVKEVGPPQENHVQLSNQVSKKEIYALHQLSPDVQHSNMVKASMPRVT